MAPKISRGFSATQKVDEKTETSKLGRAHPPPKKDGGKKVVITDTICPKKRTTEETQEMTHEPSKRQKTKGAPSFVESQLGPLIAPFINDKEVKVWQNMKLTEENDSMIEASAQLRIQSLGRAQKFEQENSKFLKTGQKM